MKKEFKIQIILAILINLILQLVLTQDLPAGII